ncbi:MAG: hypothetical protein M0Z69_07890 [Actinomycetota bacterium]|nr:hypothetical protein [Actinomycetota bacterium]
MDELDLSHLIDDGLVTGGSPPPIDVIVGRHRARLRRRLRGAGALALALVLVGTGLGLGLSAGRPPAARSASSAVARPRPAAPAGLSFVATRAGSGDSSVHGGAAFADAAGRPAAGGGVQPKASLPASAPLCAKAGCERIPAPRLGRDQLVAELIAPEPGVLTTVDSYPLQAYGWKPVPHLCASGALLVVTLSGPGPGGPVLSELIVPADSNGHHAIETLAAAVLGSGSTRVEVVVARTSAGVAWVRANWPGAGRSASAVARPTLGWSVLAVPYASGRSGVVAVSTLSPTDRLLEQAVVPALGSLAAVGVACTRGG